MLRYFDKYFTNIPPNPYASLGAPLHYKTLVQMLSLLLKSVIYVKNVKERRRSAEIGLKLES